MGVITLLKNYLCLVLLKVIQVSWSFISNLIGVPSDWSSFNRWSLAPFDFCKQAYLTNQILLNSDGSQVRNWVSIYHLFTTIHKYLDHDKNLIVHAAGRSMTVLDFAHAISDVFNELFRSSVVVHTTKNSGNPKEFKRLFVSNYLSPDSVLHLDHFVRFVVTQLAS